MNLNKNCAIDILDFILGESELYEENMNERYCIPISLYNSPVILIKDLFSVLSPKYSNGEIAVTLLILKNTSTIDLITDKRSDENEYKYVTIMLKGYELLLKLMIS